MRPAGLGSAAMKPVERRRTVAGSWPRDWPFGGRSQVERGSVGVCDARRGFGWGHALLDDLHM